MPQATQTHTTNTPAPDIAVSRARDGELLEACEAFAALQLRFEALNYGHPPGSAAERRHMLKFQKLCTVEDELVLSVVRPRARTLRGLRARALLLCPPTETAWLEGPAQVQIVEAIVRDLARV